MPKPSRDRTNKKFSGNHQRSWLWGYHAVCETLAANKWPVLELLVTEAAYERARPLLDEKVRSGIPLTIVSADRIKELSKAADHQGYLARLGLYPYIKLHEYLSSLRELMDRARDRENGSKPTEPLPLLVLCDRLQDSFNLGAILRCCDGAGVQAVIVGDKNQAEVTSHVSRSSAGAVNYLPIVKTEDLLDAAQRLKAIGFRIIAADSNASGSLWTTNLRHPVVLVIGSEAHGVDERLLEQCDERLLIPMQGQVSSLNAAVASGIILYEIRRQQQP